MSKPEIPRLIYGSIQVQAAPRTMRGEDSMVMAIKSLCAHAVNACAATCVTCPNKELRSHEDMRTGDVSLAMGCGHRGQCPDGFNHREKGWQILHATGEAWVLPGEVPDRSAMMIEWSATPPAGMTGHQTLKEIDETIHSMRVGAVMAGRDVESFEPSIHQKARNLETWAAESFTRTIHASGVTSASKAWATAKHEAFGPHDPDMFRREYQTDFYADPTTTKPLLPVENPDVPMTFIGDSW